MSKRPTPETKWYVTEYPEECSFAITDGNEILVTIIGGNTIGDQCDLASRIAKLPDLERERDEARKELKIALEQWELCIEQITKLKNDIVGLENKWKCAVDMAARAEIERDDALEEIRKLKIIIDYIERKSNE